ncbi:transposase [Streptomyces sp. NPDC006527]|uniref:transposase n=1 Tax=Streptomyces sp. NPDC006527 TaxID=3364749 RepID=UPI00369D5823
MLAHRVKQPSAEAATLTPRITAITQVHDPQLLGLTGVGPDRAAILLIAAGDNYDRLRDEASFAALCGVSLVERSSGKSQGRRLNRGGATGKPTRPSTASFSPACAGRNAPVPTCNDGLQKARRSAKSSAASRGMWPARSTAPLPLLHCRFLPAWQFDEP